MGLLVFPNLCLIFHNYSTLLLKKKKKKERHLGGSLGNDIIHEKCASDKVKNWCDEIERPSEFEMRRFPYQCPYGQQYNVNDGLNC